MAQPKRQLPLSTPTTTPTTLGNDEHPSAPASAHSPTPSSAPAIPLPNGSTFSGSHPLPLNASNILLHNSQFGAPHSRTHAGGIQPSANFFKPMRPADYPGSNSQRYPPPSSMGIQVDDDAVREDTEESFRVNPKRASGHLPIPHPLSPGLSASLSQHQHHHSNHSLEDLKQHEDNGVPPSDTEDGEHTKRVVKPQLSREPLIETIPGATSKMAPSINVSIPSTRPAGVQSPGPGSSRPSFPIGPTSPNAARFGLMKNVFTPGTDTPPRSAVSATFDRNSLRKSLDLSITTKRSKRNSVYKPRLTFESLRRSSLSKDDTSRRESYLTDEDTDHSKHPNIPMTPTKARIGSRKVKRRRSSSSQSRSSSVVTSDDDSLDEGPTTPSPASFNPTPPVLRPGEFPKMRTPLHHPLDPSLVPIEKLERELALRTKRKRRRGILEKITGQKEKQPGLPTIVKVPSTEDSTNVSDDGKQGRLARRYELHPSRNRFYFGGRIMVGGDTPWAFITTLCLFCGLSGLWFATTGMWWWREAGRSPSLISFGNPPPIGLDHNLSFQRSRAGPSALGVEGRDWSWVTVDETARRAGKAIVFVCAYLAGICISTMLVTAFSDPGILPRNLDPDPPYPANSPSDGGIRAPMPRDIKVREDVVRVKYCPTCKTYRPPRASHCKMVRGQYTSRIFGN